MTRSRWVHAVAAALIASSFILWYATGAEGFTRWPNARLEGADAAPAAGELDLLAEVGFDDGVDAAARPEFRSRFAFGLVPGGFDPPHLVSVVTVAGLALIASVATVALGRGCCVCRTACAPQTHEGTTE